MPIAGIRNVFPFLVYSLLVWAALVDGPRPAFAQTAASSLGQADEVQSVSGTSPSSDQPSDGQQQPSTQSVTCGVAHLGQCFKDIGHDQAAIWASPLRIVPRDAIWLVPGGVRIKTGDGVPLARTLGFCKS
jgi:hypothetical protein